MWSMLLILAYQNKPYDASNDKLVVDARHNEAQQLLELSVKRMQLSARAYHRVLKLSRTTADLGASPTTQVQHVAEAIQYRPKPSLN